VDADTVSDLEAAEAYILSSDFFGLVRSGVKVTINPPGVAAEIDGEIADRRAAAQYEADLAHFNAWEARLSDHLSGTTRGGRARGDN
jgi:hypothetical protein